MPTLTWNDIPKEQTNPTFARQVIHTENMTVARVHLVKGGRVPDHHHVNEQVCVVLEGSLKFWLAGVEHTVSVGQVLPIPPNVVHSVEALEDSLALDLFSPRREDWLAGDDSYLRQTETR